MLPSAPQKESAEAELDLGRYAGLGLTFVVASALFGGLGWWVDGRLGTAPWLLVVGVFLGSIVGFIVIVRSVPAAKPVHLHQDLPSNTANPDSDTRTPRS